MIGKRIKSARESVGLSQTDLAKKVGISKQTLYKYETGIVTNIPSDKIESISHAIHVTPAYLMGWTGSDPDIFTYTPREQTLIEHYRSADPGTQASVDKLLDMPGEENIGESAG